METFNGYFDRLYKKNNYLDKFGGSVVTTTITLFCFFLIFSYYYVQNKIEPIRQDWANQRCRPEVMPFAGMINAPKGVSQTEYTSENFMRCTTTILSSITAHFLKPFYYISDLLVRFFKTLMNSVNMIRIYILSLRIKLERIFQYLIARIVNVMIPLQNILIKLKDTMAKTMGIATTGLYTVYGSYLAIKAFMGSFLQILILALVIAAAAIIILWILPFTWPAAAAGTVFFLLISIPVAIIAGWTSHILNISSRRVPGKPSCFDENTIIETMKGKEKIKNIKSGTKLKNGDRITGIFKLALNNLDVYKLGGIIVTGCHKVFYEPLGWIDVCDHPNSIKIEKYRKPYIYCLNTESKRIYIGNHKFLDWDDLEPIDIIKLKNLRYISRRGSMSEIHRYLESGLNGEIIIELENGNSVKLQDIKVNDHLRFGERVIGIIEIDTKNIDVKKYKFKTFSIIGGPNIHFKDSDLGNFNTLKINGEIINKNKPEKLYHLLTDTGFFTVDGYKLRDYNSAIENILDIRDKLFALF